VFSPLLLRDSVLEIERKVERARGRERRRERGREGGRGERRVNGKAANASFN
jgi:hypothetical protein